MIGNFPSYRYKDDPKQGVVSCRVEDPADAAAKCPPDQGWRESPDPEARPSEDPNEVLANALRRGPTGEPLASYPSYRFRVHPDTGRLEQKRVESPEDEALCCPPEDGWKDSPAGMDADHPAVEANPASGPPPRPSKPDINAPQAPLDPAEDAAKAEEYYATAQAEVIASLQSITETEVLLRCFKYEQARKPQARKPVIQAINARMHELSTAHTQEG